MEFTILNRIWTKNGQMANISWEKLSNSFTFVRFTVIFYSWFERTDAIITDMRIEYFFTKKSECIKLLGPDHDITD